MIGEVMAAGSHSWSKSSLEEVIAGGGNSWRSS